MNNNKRSVVSCASNPSIGRWKKAVLKRHLGICVAIPTDIGQGLQALGNVEIFPDAQMTIMVGGGRPNHLGQVRPRL